MHARWDRSGQIHISVRDARVHTNIIYAASSVPSQTGGTSDTDATNNRLCDRGPGNAYFSVLHRLHVLYLE